MSKMTYYLCVWYGGDDSSHTIIKQGQHEVSEWLRECLCANGIGCPERIINQLSTLDEDTINCALPIQLTWVGVPCTFYITEITDLGALTLDKVRAECRTAWNWLDVPHYKSLYVHHAQKALERALDALGAPING